MRRITAITGATLLIIVAATATVLLRAGSAPAHAQEPEVVALFTGCNNVTLTWPNGTPTTTVAESVTPAGILVAAWRFENAAGRFIGFSPEFPAVSDLQAVNRLDAVFLCVNAAGSMNRPALVAAPAPAPIPAAPVAPPATSSRPNCADFPSQAAAQAAYRADPVGLRNLDADNDGVACEANPAPRDTTPVRTAIAPPVVAPPPPPPPPPVTRTCCRVCSTGKACGDSCIAANLNCRAGAGCACNAWIPNLDPSSALLRMVYVPMDDVLLTLNVGNCTPEKGVTADEGG